MKVFRDRRGALLLIILFAFGLLAVGCGDGDDGGAPKNISGTWEGTWTGPEGTGDMTITMQQTGKSVAGSFSVMLQGQVVESGTFSGTYENGVLVIANPDRDTVHFVGNTASAQFADGSSFTAQRA